MSGNDMKIDWKRNPEVADALEAIADELEIKLGANVLFLNTRHLRLIAKEIKLNIGVLNQEGKR